ncbi:MAG TPA: polyphosphate kinase 1 [Candidatus Limnocylindria bacterium]|nr:polyphosphate kinase 1 [Candidatus Limnocylindria bacterium]
MAKSQARSKTKAIDTALAAAPASPDPRGRRRRLRRGPALGRELSWIEFNARVLYEAADERNPLLERAKFLAIFASNLDEFFQVRISGLLRAVRSPRLAQLGDGASPAEQLAVVHARIRELVAEQSRIYRRVRRELAKAGIEIVEYAKVPRHHAALRDRFLAEIHPVLTPLAVDPGHPFPYISSLTMSVAVQLRDPQSDERRFARVKVPAVLPRLLELPPSRGQAATSHRFVLLDQVIKANLDTLFHGHEVVESHLFRVTRDADLAFEDEDAENLLVAMEEELRRRRFGDPVRLEVERSMPAATRDLLRLGLDVSVEETFEVRGMLALASLWQLVDLDRPDLKVPPLSPAIPPRLLPPDDDVPADAFAAIRAGDILVHHPYESFAASVERLIEQAADDPDVLTIKQTLYRTSLDSEVVNDLIRAAEQGKQVVVLVEVKARFDEQANIGWARKLERAGAHVVYGLVGLKTHCKTLLIVRREGGVLRRYVHVGTGNYNNRTARSYVDLGLFTVREDIGADVTDLFNMLTGLSRQRTFRRLLVAPTGMRNRFLELVDREIEHATAGRPAGIVLKMNALVDRACVEGLYRASRAGIGVDLLIRGACTLVPGVEGLSDRIRVRSTIGEFLEHSRIWRFENGGSPEWFIGSADLMDRNLDRRIEAFAPIDDPDARAEIDEILRVMLADDRRSWVLAEDGRWQRVEQLTGKPGTYDGQQVLKARAAQRSHDASVPRRGQAPLGMVEPPA